MINMIQCNFCEAWFPEYMLYAVGSDMKRHGVYAFCSSKCSECFWQLGVHTSIEFDPRIMGDHDEPVEVL